MAAKTMTWGAAALLVLGLALWFARGRGASSAPAGPAPAPVKLSVADAEAQLAEHEERARNFERPADPDDSAAPAETPSAADVLTVGARLLDERNRPLAGGRLAWLVTEENGQTVTKHEAISDRSGAVWLVLLRSELPEGALLFEAGAPGRVTQSLPVESGRRENVSIVSLGELTLRAGPAEGPAPAGK